MQTNIRLVRVAAAASLYLAAIPSPGASRNFIWAQVGSDMALPANWIDYATGQAATSAPGTEDRLFFTNAVPAVQPYLSRSLEIRAVCFGPVGSNGRTNASLSDGRNGYAHCGWTLSGADGAELKLSGSFPSTGNWNFHFSQASYGTNTIAVPVRFTATDGNYRAIQPSGGRLVFARPVASDSESAIISIDGGSGGGAVLAAANPGLQGAILVGASSLLAFQDAAAFGNVRSIALNHAGSSAVPQRLLNETGGGVALDGITNLTSTARNVRCHIGGDGAIAITNAVWSPRLRDDREFYIDVPLSVKSIENGDTSSTGGFSFRKRGPATLRVLEDVFRNAPDGQTNRIDIVDGAIVLENDDYLRRDCLLIGIVGTLMEEARPALGVRRDLAVADGGNVPGGILSYGDHGYSVGFAAYDGDHVVNFFDGATYKMIDPTVSYASEFKVDEDKFGAGSSAWFRRAKRLIFGAPDADGTVTLANDLDVNVMNANYSANLQTFHAIQGLAPVAGRIAGSIINLGEAGANGARLAKRGDGVLALDGDVRLLSANGSWLYEGGLLVNGTFTGPLYVTNTLATAPFSWLGGTGTLAPVSSNGTSTITTTICGGGALRPGDEYRSGSLEVATDLTIADGGRLVVHVGSDANTCLRCTGSGCDFRVSGTAILRVETDGTLERGRSIKIADFSGASNPSYLTFVDPARWTFELPDGSPIHHPSLFVAEDALWLKFSVDTGENYKVLFW